MNTLRHVLLFLCFLIPTVGASKTVRDLSSLREKLLKIPSVKKGTMGIMVSDLSTGETLGINHDRLWYLASTVKVPIAGEVLRQIEMKKFGFETKVTLKPSDRRDGSGEVSYLKSGSQVSVRYLLEQMLLESDNAATDKLLELVEIENVNSTLQREVPEGFKTMTSLLDVRRQAYSNLHPLALQMNGDHFIQIKNAKSYKKRAEVFSRISKTPSKFFKNKTVEAAFENYYKSHLNSGTLIAYTQLLTKIYRREFVSRFVSDELFKLMERCRTGKNRVKKNFSSEWIFAHKTGTQIARACDMGILKIPSSKSALTITICAEGWRSLTSAEKEMAEVGSILAEKLKE